MATSTDQADVNNFARSCLPYAIWEIWRRFLDGKRDNVFLGVHGGYLDQLALHFGTPDSVVVFTRVGECNQQYPELSENTEIDIHGSGGFEAELVAHLLTGAMKTEGRHAAVERLQSQRHFHLLGATTEHQRDKLRARVTLNQGLAKLTKEERDAIRDHFRS